MQPPHSGHDPVLVEELSSLLALREGATLIDGTLGRGGHASVFGQQLGKTGTLVGLDVDPRNLEFARERLKSLPCRVRLFEANFARIDQVWDEIGKVPCDAVLVDLGVSTNQLFDRQYGLSFGESMPLDMRLDPSLRTSAADLVNKLPADELADILFDLAQERFSRRIARKIIESRSASPILTTDRLADVVRSAVPSQRGKRGAEKIDPATRTFLALRMKVNRETENLARLLEQAPKILAAGGRLAVISFQSTEDRIVKQAFRSAEQTGLVRVLTTKPISPTEAEIAANPRSRSAKLRVVQK